MKKPKDIFNKKNIIETKASECGEYKYVTYKGYGKYIQIRRVYHKGELILCYYDVSASVTEIECYKDGLLADEMVQESIRIFNLKGESICL